MLVPNSKVLNAPETLHVMHNQLRKVILPGRVVSVIILCITYRTRTNLAFGSSVYIVL